MPTLAIPSGQEVKSVRASFLWGKSQSKMKIIAFLILLLSSTAAFSSELYDEFHMNGWVENYKQQKRKIHYEIRIKYKHNNEYFNSPRVISTKITIGNVEIEFPKEACILIGPAWPSGIGISAAGPNEYTFYYLNCGDGAKSFAMFYTIKNGFLTARHLEAASGSELHDELMLFDKNGDVTYNGPCNRQGQPLRK